MCSRKSLGGFRERLAGSQKADIEQPPAVHFNLDQRLISLLNEVAGRIYRALAALPRELLHLL